MSKENKKYSLKKVKDLWVLNSNKSKRAIRKFTTKSEGLKAAKTIAKEQEASLSVFGKDGKMQQKLNYKKVKNAEGKTATKRKKLLSKKKVSSKKQKTALQKAIEKAIKRHGVPTKRKLPKASKIDIQEKKLGLKFHADYRSLLLKANDLTIDNEIEFATVQTVAAMTKEYRKYYDLPKDVVVIAIDNGHLFCLKLNGSVYFESRGLFKKESWRSLASWVNNVLAK